MDTVEDLRHDARRLRERIVDDIEEFMENYPDVAIDYGSIWHQKKKGVKIRLDFKLKK